MAIETIAGSVCSGGRKEMRLQGIYRTQSLLHMRWVKENIPMCCPHLDTKSICIYQLLVRGVFAYICMTIEMDLHFGSSLEPGFWFLSL